MGVVGLSDALQLRLHLRLVLFLLRALRRHQRVATYVVLVVVLYNGVDYFPPPLVRASNGMDDLVLYMSNHPLRDGRVSERDVMGYVLLPLAPLLRLVRRQPGLRVGVNNFRLASHLPESLFRARRLGRPCFPLYRNDCYFLAEGVHDQ